MKKVIVIVVLFLLTPLFWGQASNLDSLLNEAKTELSVMDQIRIEYWDDLIVPSKHYVSESWKLFAPRNSSSMILLDNKKQIILEFSANAIPDLERYGVLSPINRSPKEDGNQRAPIYHDVTSYILYVVPLDVLEKELGIRSLFAPTEDIFTECKNIYLSDLEKKASIASSSLLNSLLSKTMKESLKRAIFNTWVNISLEKIGLKERDSSFFAERCLNRAIPSLLRRQEVAERKILEDRIKLLREIFESQNKALKDYEVSLFNKKRQPDNGYMTMMKDSRNKAFSAMKYTEKVLEEIYMVQARLRKYRLEVLTMMMVR